MLRSALVRGAHAASPGDWNDLVVVCAGTHYVGHRLGAQHLADRLTRYAPVLYVDPPVSRGAARNKPFLRQTLQGGDSRLRVVRERLANLVPVVPPGKTRAGVRTVAGVVLRRELRAAVAALGAQGRVHAVVVVPPHFRVLGTLGERLGVHLASDDFAAGARMQGVSEAWVRRRERRLAATADRVVAVSPPLVDKWRALGHEPVFMPNGCDAALLAGADGAPPPDDVDLPRPIAGFLGTLSERIDVALLEAVARRGRSLLLVGPRSFTAPNPRLDALLAMPNVRWVGARPHTTMPSYLRTIDVGLVPYADTPFNRASFPLKVLDYLAAGRPVVSSDLPSVRWLDTSLLWLATAPGAFADAVDVALRQDVDPRSAARRRAYAAEHSWDRRIEVLAAVLDRPPTGSVPGRPGSGSAGRVTRR